MSTYKNWIFAGFIAVSYAATFLYFGYHLGKIVGCQTTIYKKISQQIFIPPQDQAAVIKAITQYCKQEVLN